MTLFSTSLQVVVSIDRACRLCTKPSTVFYTAFYNKKFVGVL